MNYRAKHINVQAWFFPEKRQEESIPQWVQEIKGFRMNFGLFFQSGMAEEYVKDIILRDKRGTYRACPGHWIVRNKDAEVWIFLPDVFERLYRKVA